MSIILTTILLLCNPAYKNDCVQYEAKQYFECIQTNEIDLCQEIHRMAVEICRVRYNSIDEFLYR